MRAGWVWTNNPDAPAVTVYRRGPQARGRARKRGRSSLWWLVAFLLWY